ncbi:MAG: D-2-hydroxyacid dehydrogenase [Prevotella sp.]|nr:D-2-hydroxyacid dehydrogenase [Prevotella sp.]
MKIVELDGYAANPGDLSWEPLRELGELMIYDRTAPADVVERAKDADMVLINKIMMTEEVMKQLPRLKYIGVLATGYNVVDIDAARKHGIVVTNIPAYSTDSVAQTTFALLLAITNRVEHYAEENRNGRWSRNPDFCYWDTPLVELAGKTMGIVGLGNIGMRVATIAKDFGMDVFALTSKNSTDLPPGIQKTTLEGLLAVSDILSLHCPLTEQTNRLINRNTIAKMKHGAILINTGRGQLVDETDVADALANGKLAAYGADVMSCEPPQANNPLFAQPNAFLTPHIAWATREARQRLMEIAVNNVKAFINGKPQNVVNP